MKINKLLLKIIPGTIIFVGFVYSYWKFGCYENGCDVVTIVGILDPVLVFGIGLLIIQLYLLFFSTEILVKWLKYIVSWYIPVLLLIVSSVPVFSGNILHISRTKTVFGAMVLLFLITVIYTLVLWRKGKKSVK